MKVIEGLLYTKDHDWVKYDGEEACIGITDYAQHALGSIVFIELPEEGASIPEGDVFCTIESVKAASDSYMPMGGEIIEINESLQENPELLNKDPYGSWIVHFKMSDPEKLSNLMIASEYEEFCSKEA